MNTEEPFAYIISHYFKCVNCEVGSGEISCFETLDEAIRFLYNEFKTRPSTAYFDMVIEARYKDNTKEDIDLIELGYITGSERKMAEKHEWTAKTLKLVGEKV